MRDGQLSIFDIEIPNISLNDAALQLNVSVASLHNWIKEGILKHSNNCISQKSIDDFRDNYLYKNKLSSRANKQYKDIHDHNLLTIKIDQDINSNISGKDISDAYELSLSESYKNKEGIYYTPQYIVEDMMTSIDITDNKTFLDPCCGSGNFIIEAIKKGFSPENVYGFDTDKNAIAIAKKRIKEICGYDSNNIICADFLETAKNIEQQFDYIFTNPPWGKKINKNDKTKFSSLYKSGSSSDTSALFYFAALKILKKDGIIAFLLPDSFFNISTFEDARKSLLKLNIKRLIDYHKPFKGILTKVKAFIAINNNDIQNNIIHCEIYNDREYYRSQLGFNNIPKNILNFNIDETENNVISHVFHLPYITLKNNAKWALGIVTGNNNAICKKEPFEDSVPIYKGADIHKDKLMAPSLYIERSLSKCRQVADINYYLAPNKIIYRFISDKIICHHDTGKRYILNSANLFILNDNIPINYDHICNLFNSDFMNWLFKSIFNTHKILRSDLEMLPIWHEYFELNNKFNEESLLEYLQIEKTNGTYRVKKQDN